jgi:lipoprotein NlpD
VRTPTWLALLALSAVVLGACAGKPAAPDSYVVRSGDTLYGIAWRHNLDYRDLARWNQLGADYRITVGQRLRLAGKSSPPMAGSGAGAQGGAALGSGSAARSQDAPPHPKDGLRQVPGTGRPAVPDPRQAPGQALAMALSAHLVWVWPTDHGTPRPVQSGGILLPGSAGEIIRAAAAGRVVYTGSGIRGYGQLLIIKHSDLLLSAYAYNQDVLVSEGQEVTTGQTVAHMGDGPHHTPVLYFEIRVNGKPINPLPLLPKTLSARPPSQSIK